MMIEFSAFVAIKQMVQDLQKADQRKTAGSVERACPSCAAALPVGWNGVKTHPQRFLEFCELSIT